MYVLNLFCWYNLGFTTVNSRNAYKMYWPDYFNFVALQVITDITTILLLRRFTLLHFIIGINHSYKCIDAGSRNNFRFNTDIITKLINACKRVTLIVT